MKQTSIAPFLAGFGTGFLLAVINAVILIWFIFPKPVPQQVFFATTHDGRQIHLPSQPRPPVVFEKRP
tara:strand:- start:220 stop:423 length:204 start_codon:yes stop_codon:yes gene_type:complete